MLVYAVRLTVFVTVTVAGVGAAEATGVVAATDPVPEDCLFTKFRLSSGVQFPIVGGVAGFATLGAWRHLWPGTGLAAAPSANARKPAVTTEKAMLTVET